MTKVFRKHSKLFSIRFLHHMTLPNPGVNIKLHKHLRRGAHSISRPSPPLRGRYMSWDWLEIELL